MRKIILFCLMSLLSQVVYPCNFGADESYLAQLGTPAATQGSPARTTRSRTPIQLERGSRPSTPVIVEAPEVDKDSLPENRRSHWLVMILLAAFFTKNLS
jgi:hypothetical protein